MARITIHRVAAAFLVATSAAVAIGAQSGPGRPQTTFRTGVDIVRLDVSVLDKNRRPIRNLTAADFTVLEEGEPRPLVAFSAVDVSDPPDHPVAWMRDVGSDVAWYGSRSSNRCPPTGVRRLEASSV